MDDLPDEAALVERARGGDVGAYGRLVEGYQEVAFRLAFVITGSADDAEDAAQAAFLKAFAAIRRFRRGAPVRPWLLRIVANEARNRRRQERRQQRLVPRVGDAEPRGAAGRSAEDAALADETHRRVALALDRLRDEERLAIFARYFLDLSEADSAAVLGCAPGTVKSRLARALERLRADLGEERDA